MTESQYPQPAPKHMPGPWATWDCKQMQARGVTGPTAAAAITATADIQRLDYAKCSEVLTIDGQVAAIALGKTQAEAHANARLIAAAPDYHDAAFWIRQAVANNAAPVNPLAALEEMALDGEHVTLDAGLVLDLLKAHARATGAQA